MNEKGRFLLSFLVKKKNIPIHVCIKIKNDLTNQFDMFLKSSKIV